MPRGSAARGWLAMLVLVGLLGGPATALAGDTVRTEPPWEERDAAGRAWVRARSGFDAPADQVFAVLLDVARYPEFIPGVVSAQLLETTTDMQLVRFRSRSGPFTGDYTVRRDIDRAARRIAWRRVAGDLRDLEGFWRVAAAPDGGSVVDYGCHLDPAAWLPGAAVRFQQKRGILDLFAALRRRLDLAAR